MTEWVRLSFCQNYAFFLLVQKLFIKIIRKKIDTRMKLYFEGENIICKKNSKLGGKNWLGKTTLIGVLYRKKSVSLL